MPGEMVNICAALQSIAGHVIVDLPSVFNDYVLALIEASDECSSSAAWTSRASRT